MLAVIGAHPDDAELGAGGWLVKEDALIISMTSGCNHARDSRVAKNEQERAADILHVTVHNLGHPQLTYVSQEMVGELDEVFDNAHVDTVITHALNDSNQEHALTSQAVLAASRRLNRVLFFEPTPPARGDFKPQMYLDITDYAEDKFKAINQYKSQVWRKGKSLVDTRMALDRWRGAEIDVEAAECYQVVRWKF